ncbi:MAG: sigma-70 family RNA polymerase sigma factor [Polyangiaceae bacterium]|nr:sigma-70 family RNA polymerase sigma factor [Polyangiaceae bacterium]
MYPSASSPSVPAPSTLDASAPPDARTEERQLLAGLLADQPRAWVELERRYGRLLERCITKVTSRFSAVVGAEDVREIRAVLLLSLLANDKHKLRSFEVDRGVKLGSWLGMLAAHAAYDYLRGLRREPRRAAVVEAERLSSDAADPFEVLDLRERARAVERLLCDFTEKDREFIGLYFGEGLEPEEVAARMGISVKTVYSKKHKIRSRLAELLGGERLAA